MSHLDTSFSAPLPRVTVVTVSMNDAGGLAATMESVAGQSYENFQYVVVDGGSTDGSPALLRQYEALVDKCVCEMDQGTYHAMNKSLLLADGEWLLFMNAGDVFASPDALSAAVSCIDGTADVVYSDWIYRESGKRVHADKKRMIVRHQSVLYRADLHRVFGTYTVGRGVTISDFIFFMAISERRWVYCGHPISICEQGGASAYPSHFHQRIATEFIFGKRSRMELIGILLLHPAYWFIKTLFRR